MRNFSRIRHAVERLQGVGVILFGIVPLAAVVGGRRRRRPRAAKIRIEFRGLEVRGNRRIHATGGRISGMPRTTCAAARRRARWTDPLPPRDRRVLRPPALCTLRAPRTAGALRHPRTARTLRTSLTARTLRTPRTAFTLRIPRTLAPASSRTPSAARTPRTFARTPRTLSCTPRTLSGPRPRPDAAGSLPDCVSYIRIMPLWL